MLARVKWATQCGCGGKGIGGPSFHHGTLLQFIDSSYAMVSQDGCTNEPYKKGKIVRCDVFHLTVTTWFKWF